MLDRPSHVHFLRLLTVLTLGGCYPHRTLSHAETAATCPPTPPVPPVSVADSGPPGAIVGEIVDSRSGDPIGAARVTILDAQRQPVAVDSHVTRRPFTLQPVTPGSYTLVVLGLAYQSREVPLVLSASSGLSIRVPLDVMPFDGCPGVARSVVRRPWWQWWYPPKRSAEDW